MSGHDEVLFVPYENVDCEWSNAQIFASELSARERIVQESDGQSANCISEGFYNPLPHREFSKFDQPGLSCALKRTASTAAEENETRRETPAVAVEPLNETGRFAPQGTPQRQMHYPHLRSGGSRNVNALYKTDGHEIAPTPTTKNNFFNIKVQCFNQRTTFDQRAAVQSNTLPASGSVPTFA